MEHRKKTIRRLAFVAWFVTATWLWHLAVDLKASFLNSFTVSILTLAVISLCAVVRLLYEPIGTLDLASGFRRWIDAITTVISVITIGHPISENYGFFALLAAGIVYASIYLAFRAIFEHLLHDYREESTYPRFIDDWRPTPQREH